MDFNVFVAFRLRPLLGTLIFSCLVSMPGAPFSEPKCKLISAFRMSPWAHTTIESRTVCVGNLYRLLCWGCCIRLAKRFMDFCIIVAAMELKLMCSIRSLAFS